MSKRRDSDFLRDILEAAHRIESYTEGMTYETFLRDTKTQDAVIRNLEIVGEATRTRRLKCARNITTCPGEGWLA